MMLVPFKICLDTCRETAGDWVAYVQPSVSDKVRVYKTAYYKHKHLHHGYSHTVNFVIVQLYKIMFSQRSG